jgi:hypothetical protein
VLIDGHRSPLGEPTHALRTRLIAQSQASQAQARHSGMRVQSALQASLF